MGLVPPILSCRTYTFSLNCSPLIFLLLLQYSSQMRVYMNTLEAVSINKLDSMDGVDPLAASTLKRTWNIALGGE